MNKYFILKNYPQIYKLMWLLLVSPKPTRSSWLTNYKMCNWVGISHGPIGRTSSRRWRGLSNKQPPPPYMSESEHARHMFMEIRMKGNVLAYIQGFWSLMYKIPQIIEAFMLFMRGLKPRFRKQIGYHVEGDWEKMVATVEKANVWWSQANGNKKGQKHRKARSLGQYR